MSDNIENKLGYFFSGLSATLNSVREVQKVYNPIIAFDFNPFNRFWWLDENKVSDIIAFFLNPNETHAQGNIFLKLFLEKFKFEKPLQMLRLGTSTKVITNYPTDNGRWIDIVINFGENKFLIGIENKIYDNTKDQNKQVSDYCEDLINKSHGYSILLYLAPDGKIPTEDSITESERIKHEKNDHLKFITYQKDIIDLVYQWFIHCQAERVRVFLIEFHQHLKNNYMGETFINEHKVITDYIIKNNEIETARSIFNSWGKVKLLLIEEFKKQIKQIADELNKEILNYSIDEDLGANNKGFYFYPKEWKNYRIGFGFETNWFYDFYYGICIINENTNIPLSNILERTTQLSKIFTEEPNDYWPRSEYFKEYRNWDDESPVWKDIADKSLKKNIINKIDYILKELSSLY